MFLAQVPGWGSRGPHCVDLRRTPAGTGWRPCPECGGGGRGVEGWWAGVGRGWVECRGYKEPHARPRCAKIALHLHKRARDTT